MAGKGTPRARAYGRPKEELGSLIADNRSLRHEVVSLMLDIAILREQSKDVSIGSLRLDARNSVFEARRAKDVSRRA